MAQQKVKSHKRGGRVVVSHTRGYSGSTMREGGIEAYDATRVEQSPVHNISLNRNETKPVESARPGNRAKIRYVNDKAREHISELKRKKRKGAK
jgi:hypothetical protein